MKTINDVWDLFLKCREIGIFKLGYTLVLCRDCSGTVDGHVSEIIKFDSFEEACELMQDLITVISAKG